MKISLFSIHVMPFGMRPEHGWEVNVSGAAMLDKTLRIERREFFDTWAEVVAFLGSAVKEWPTGSSGTRLPATVEIQIPTGPEGP